MSPYKQQKPLSEGIKVEQPMEPSYHPVRRKNLDRNFQPMADVNGGFWLSKKTNQTQDYSHTNSESANPAEE